MRALRLRTGPRLKTSRPHRSSESRYVPLSAMRVRQQSLLLVVPLADRIAIGLEMNLSTVQFEK